ncbi:unnamed protein product [Rotaria sordida]|uniref:Uncharacterized protein n=1 Tax=Rotaria sordida TaxID=392033 RepID=A0A813Z448_9BILA|nr:unnamed protein product [Rotaria sordida]CAF0946940.1 unnamed protein product [Rotaria sordida]CAF0966833.1 unnamed protein product [Rotaria sordida]CAF1017279.1 unnamed protein product [Rotaria sordida]CAF1017863.1 unnamed protein product [Rotaria sordida]
MDKGAFIDELRAALTDSNKLINMHRGALMRVRTYADMIEELTNISSQDVIKDVQNKYKQNQTEAFIIKVILNYKNNLMVNDETLTIGKYDQLIGYGNIAASQSNSFSSDATNPNEITDKSNEFTQEVKSTTSADNIKSGANKDDTKDKNFH